MADDDGTDWRSISIPNRTRKLAAEDPRTYEEIIRDGLDVERVDEGIDVDLLAERLKAKLEG